VQNIISTCLNKFVEPILNYWPVNKLRERALQNLMEHIHYEDETTKYICLGPVNKVKHDYFLLLNILKPY
jgi:achilleol B synthase